MKFVVVVLFAVLFVCQCIRTQAAEVSLRSKHSLLIEYCPENSTGQECFEYAEKELAKDKLCATYVLKGNLIEWQFCGTLRCNFKAETFEPIEDMSKAYPECCAKCDFAKFQMSKQ